MFSFDFCEILRTSFCGNRTTPGDCFLAISTSFAKKLFCRFFNGFYIWLLYAILTNSPVSIWHNFLQKSSEILILIPIIPQNILKLYAKKSTLNMTEFASLKKFRTKNIIMKRNIQFWDVSDLPGFIQAHFSNFLSLP